MFAGFGVSAPELGHDDFAELDVRGKVVVEFRGAPPRFPHDERAYYSHSLVKEQAAVSRGAVGILQVLKPADQVASRGTARAGSRVCRGTDGWTKAAHPRTCRRFSS